MSFERASQADPSVASRSGAEGMRALMLAHDWQATPIGAMAGWPPTQTVAELSLANRFPSVVVRSRELIQVYNDSSGR